MDKAETRAKIAKLIERLDVTELRSFHRQMEVANARAILAGTDDRLSKDVEFLVRSAVFLIDIGSPNDWKLQLQAALGVLDSAATHNKV